jgi:GNAT superfamily N-acetyltransferase
LIQCQNPSHTSDKSERRYDERVKIDVGCSLEEYRSYYRTLDGFHRYLRTLGLTDVTVGELGSTEAEIIKNDPTHLIVLRKQQEIIGHAIWHEASTDEHRAGDPRDTEDRDLLRKLCGGQRNHLVELHELWLRKRWRGRGYGKRFFEFFEEFVKAKGYHAIVYYTEHPAARAICRKRGWKEGFLTGEGWYVYCLSR